MDDGRNSGDVPGEWVIPAYRLGFVSALLMGAAVCVFVGLAGLPWVITPLALAGCAAVIWLQTR